jgi:IS4 transposase
MLVDATTITQVYKNRWHVESFFKWIKQHLHVKSFYGRSDNAVRSQIWIVMCVYLLLAKLKKQLELPQTLNEIQQILSVTTFEKTPVLSVFFDDFNKSATGHNPNQLLLFKF